MSGPVLLSSRHKPSREKEKITISRNEEKCSGNVHFIKPRKEVHVPVQYVHAVQYVQALIEKCSATLKIGVAAMLQKCMLLIIH